MRTERRDRRVIPLARLTDAAESIGDGKPPKVGPPTSPTPKPRGRPKKARQNINDTRPVVRLQVGEIKQAVDAAESALISRGDLYQRSNRIVSIGSVPVITHDRNEVFAQRIIERGEYALAENLAETACVERWSERYNAYVAANPPAWLIKTLVERSGRYRFPVLAGVINAPTLRRDGSLLIEAGYDRQTGLFLDIGDTTFPPLIADPTREMALLSLKVIDELVDGFPFVEDADRSVAHSAILTACIRRSLRTAPLHAFTAPAPGSGKSKLVDIASVIASGREAGVLAQGKTEEEMEKRLGALFLDGASVVAIDNCEAPVGGDFLCQVLTQTQVTIRPLGRSEVVEVATDSFVTATGNNLILTGDMTRRALLCDLNAGVERPELRTFASEPVATVKAHRGPYVAAALTILLAYYAAGRPRQVAPLGSFEEWSDTVRSALMWLGCADPAATMEKARTMDPQRDALASVMINWHVALGDRRVTTRQIIDMATEQRLDGKTEFIRPDFREALLTVAGSNGTINSRMLGKWFLNNKDRMTCGLWIDRRGLFEGSMTWSLRGKSAAE